MVEVERVTGLLHEAYALGVRQRKYWSNNSDRFNVFDALAIEDLELEHSKFLAFLLNPRQRHDQGDRFLRSFLHLIGITAPPHGLDTAEVTTETRISEGRLDILIRIPSKLTVCIENKVWAIDQEDQINKYLRWLNSASMITPSKAFVYLTPKGASPTNPIDDRFRNQLIEVSYASLAGWLERQRQVVPDRLGTVISMYSQTCARIAGDTMSSPYSNELAQILTSPDNIETALNIVECMNVEKRRIHQGFWGNVRRALDDYLASSDFRHAWTTVLSEDPTISYSELSIIPVGDPSGSSVTEPRTAPCYGVTMQCLANIGEPCYYGLRRPTRVKTQDRNSLDMEISRELGERGFNLGHRALCGWRKASDFGLPHASQGDIEWIMRLNNDNKTGDAPLAQQVAHDLWGFFWPLRTRIEQLNAWSTSS